MKKKILIIVFLVVILAGGLFYGFLSLAKTMELPVPQAEIIAVDGKALLVNVDGEKQITVGNILEKQDTIKTGPDGEVEIDFFDDAVSRIGPNSEVKIEEVFLRQEDDSRINIALKILTGDVWSRVNQLLDKDASYKITTGNTVALVRGTAFNFSVGPNGDSRIQAVENFVEISSLAREDENHTNPINLLEGSEISFNSRRNDIDFTKLKSQNLTPEEKTINWFTGNLKKDREFNERIKNKQLGIIREKVGILPGSPLYRLKLAAEKFKLVLSFNQQSKINLTASFAAGRLAEGQYLISLGRVAAGEEVVKQGRDNLKKAIGVFSIVDFKDSQNRIKKVLTYSSNIFRDITPDMPAYEAKEVLRKMREDLFSAGEKEFWLFKGREEFLDDLKNLREKNPEAWRKYLFGNKEKIIDIENTDDPVFHGRLHVLINILLDEKGIMSEVEKNPAAANGDRTTSSPASGGTTGTNGGGGAVRPVGGGGSGGSSGIIKVSSKNGAILRVSSRSSTMPPNSTMQFTATLEYNDGSTEDVTNVVIWALYSGDIGYIDETGLLHSGKNGGKGMVNASFSFDDGTNEILVGKSGEIYSSSVMNSVTNSYQTY